MNGRAHTIEFSFQNEVDNIKHIYHPGGSLDPCRALNTLESVTLVGDTQTQTQVYLHLYMYVCII